VISGAPFNSGILVHGSAAATTFEHAPAPTEIRRRVAGLEDLCNRFGVSLPAAALQFPRRHRAVATVLAGMRSVAELEANLRWLREPIPEAFWQAAEVLP
jgi:D-threo-aldose 1-dehydrogenase